MKEENLTKTESKKTKVIFSINLKIVLSVFCAVVVTILLCMNQVVPAYKAAMSDSIKQNMLNLAKAYGKLIDEELSISEIQTISDEKLAELLSDVSIEGLSSSYAYIVDTEGIMKYHPTADKIGAPVENSVVSGLVQQIKSGTIPKPDVVTYEFKGSMKYASYAVSSIDHSILVVTADEEEAMQPISELVQHALKTSALIAILFAGIAFFIGFLITRPIRKLTKIIQKTAQFNFEKNPASDKICRRSDETGAMAREIRHMRANLREMIANINDASETLSKNADSLQKITTKVNVNSTENSATADELAAGMEETSAITEAITESIEDVKSNITNINAMTVEGQDMSTDIMHRAEVLKNNTEDAGDKTRDMYASVKERSGAALQQAKAVEKINELAKSIMEIADQTSLLALNASIEAARAGEQGKGFAVVAGEIGNLANQSAQTVGAITEIVKEVHSAVTNMSECLATTTEFLETTVLKDYDQFIEVSSKYSNDAHIFQTSMQDINVSVEELLTTMGEIASAIAGINTTMNEAATGVTDIAEKTTDIANLTTNTYTMVQENVRYAEVLQKIVSRFKLQ